MRYGNAWPDRARVDRRGFLRLAGVGGAALLLEGRIVRSAPEPDVGGLGRLASMDFDVVYRTTIASLPRDAGEAHVWMPLPPSDHAQDVEGLRIESPVPSEITIAPPYGNRMVHVGAAAKELPLPFALEARYHVRRRRVGVEPVRLGENEREKYLRLVPPVRVTPEVEDFARRVIGGATDPYEVGRRVFDGIVELLTYDKTIAGCGLGDTAWLMKHRRGKCDDYHALFMAIMVSRGIPVRWEQGFPLPLPGPEAAASSGTLEGDCTGAHCWASFYDPSRGWVPVDVSEADKAGEAGSFYFGQLTPNRFKVSEGRAIVLAPPQGSEPLKTFAFAWAEADGLPLIYGEGGNYRNEIRYTITSVERA